LPNKRGRTLMVMGTSSSAGKSLLTAALCRCFANRGVRVAPFKAQNMSNNAAVCKDGGEIGRSQALQAMAARTTPHADMNPILLKPEGNTRSQVIVNGKPLASANGKPIEAADYFERRQQLWPMVTSALDRLREKYDLVVIEGAGSPAELNLADVEMVNMSVARYCQSPVLLVGDIERGGVFAQLLGTLWLLPSEDRALVRGLIVNKFRGDLRLFDRGVEILEERGNVPVLGVLPWIDALRLPEEDAVALMNSDREEDSCFAEGDLCTGNRLDIAVIHLPHIANFDDFDPLANDARVRLRYVRHDEDLGCPDVLILPGTKNTLGDLAWLRESGFIAKIKEYSQSSTSRIVGICGGYQMMGQAIHNPYEMESSSIYSEGLKLLDVETTFHPGKQTCQVKATILESDFLPKVRNVTLTGYEIHSGQTTTSSPWLKRLHVSGIEVSGVEPAQSRMDGSHSRDGRFWGCYLHGLFANDSFRNGWLESIGANNIDRPSQGKSTQDNLELSLEKLASHFEKYIDFHHIAAMIQSKPVSLHHDSKAT
jgi:adenosylcobyric acid synthase